VAALWRWTSGARPDQRAAGGEVDLPSSTGATRRTGLIPRRTGLTLESQSSSSSRDTLYLMSYVDALMSPGRTDDGELASVKPSFITLGSGRRISKASLFRMLQGGGWAATYVVCAAAGGQRAGGLSPMLLNPLVWALCGFLITLVVHRLYRRSLRLRHSYIVFAAIALISSVLLAPLWNLMEVVSLRATLTGIVRIDSLRPLFAEDAIALSRTPLFSPYIWPFYGIILFAWAALYFGINAFIELESQRANVVNALKLVDTARLRALQSNLNPHFLFNALNGIATLVRERDAVTAAAMIDALSTFLRSTLQRLDTPELRVAEEVELIEQYLRIQRYRFGGRLHAVVEAKQETLDAFIPTLILQPLVENAVRYSVLPRDAGGSLWVTVRKEFGVLVVSVEDDGPGLNGGTSHAFGMGLQNSSERLNALYGAEASLTIGARTAGTGCAVVIKLPFRLAPVRAAWDGTIEAEAVQA
jgi:two-component system, LytTR family, sensor kinase